MARNSKVVAPSTSKTFTWSGVDKAGKRLKSQKIVAPNQAAVVTSLRREGYLVTEVKEVSATGLNMTIGPEGVKFKWAQKAEFARRLYQMQRAGISIPAALTSMAEGAKADVAQMCLDMAEKVSAGKDFSEALGDHPRAFDDVFVSYIRSGEGAGRLVQALERLAELMAKRAAMHSKIKGVMAYPKMVGGTILIITMGIVMFLVPSYTKIYASFGAKLPAPTRALVWVSDHMLPITFKSVEIGPIPFVLPIPHPLNFISLALYVWFGWWYFRRRTKDDLEVGRKLDRIKFKMPVFGGLNHKSSLFRWASTLASSLEAGVPTQQAIELAAAASGSPWQKLVSREFVDAIRSGREMSKAMAAHPDLYPPNIRTMVATGENTGEPDEMLKSVAKALDEDVDGIIAGLSAKIEVALLLVLGGVVGGLLIVLYLPILQLATTATKGLGVG